MLGGSIRMLWLCQCLHLPCSWTYAVTTLACTAHMHVLSVLQEGGANVAARAATCSTKRAPEQQQPDNFNSSQQVTLSICQCHTCRISPSLS